MTINKRLNSKFGKLKCLNLDVTNNKGSKCIEQN